MKRQLADLAWRLAPRLMIEQHLNRRKKGMEPELWLAPRLVSRDEVAVDVGCNRGVWALQLARYAARVEAFEPNPNCLADLKRVIDDRIHLNETALSDRAGQVTLSFDPHNTGVGTIERANDLSANAGIGEIAQATVPTATLDSFALDKVGLIKIDVEGHEEAVLAGAQATLAACRPGLIIETEDRHNPGAPSRIEHTLKALGYEGFVSADGAILTLDQARGQGFKLGLAEQINNFIFLTPDRAQRAGFTAA